MADDDQGVQIEIDIKGMEKFRKKLRRGGLASGPVKDMYTQWAARLRGYWKEQYDINSKGGGSWDGLSKETIRRRKKGKDGNKTGSILRDTGTLMRAISPRVPGAPGKHTLRGRNGIEIGYGGNDVHPNVNATIAQVALWHQTGAGNNPVREIIVDPDKRTLEGMQSDTDRALDKLSKQTGNQ